MLNSIKQLSISIYCDFQVSTWHMHKDDFTGKLYTYRLGRKLVTFQWGKFQTSNYNVVVSQNTR